MSDPNSTWLATLIGSTVIVDGAGVTKTRRANLQFVNADSVADDPAHARTVVTLPNASPTVTAIGSLGAPLALRAKTGVSGSTVVALGFATLGDGGGGEFFWDTGSAVDDGGIHIIPSGGANPGPGWRRIVREESINVKWFGADPTGTLDSSPAFAAAIAYFQQNPAAVDVMGGGTLLVPAGTYKITAPIRLNRTIRLQGSSGEGYFPATIIKPVASMANVVVGRAGVTASVVAGAIIVDGGKTSIDGKSGVFSSIRDLAIIGPGSGSINHGIILYGEASVQNVFIYTMLGDGVHIDNDHTYTPPLDTTANRWRLDRVFVQGCGGAGIYTKGADSNAGSAIGCQLIANGGNGTAQSGFGIYEASSLGNFYYAAQLANNTVAPFSIVGSANSSSIRDSYTEGGGGAGRSNSNTSRVEGGIHGAGFQAGYLGYYSTGTISSPGMQVISPDGTITLLGAGDGVPLQFQPAAGGSGQFRFSTATTGYPSMNISGSSLATFMYFSDVNTGNEPAGIVFFPNGLVLGSPGARRAGGQGLFQTMGTGTPNGAGVVPGTSSRFAGPWVIGDIIWNVGVTAGGFVGWVCTASGAQGTWKTFGAVAV